MLFEGLLAASMALMSPQEIKADQVIKVRTELVELRTVVTDRQGKPIGNLAKEDFELLVNNRSHAIDYFAYVRVETDAAIPVSRAGAVPVARNLSERLAEAPVRTVILYVDNLHLAPDSLMMTKQALRQFIDEKLAPEDMIALVISTGSLGIANKFTRDRALLRYGIEKIGLGPAARASYFTPYLASCIEQGDADALTLAMGLLRREEGIEGSDRFLANLARTRASQILIEASYMRDATLQRLKESASQMAGLPGQRMIVLFSDGFTLRETGGMAETYGLEAAISQAVRSGVVIYSVDAKGLTTPAIFNAAVPGNSASVNPTNRAMSRGGNWRGNAQSNEGGSGVTSADLQGYLSASEFDQANGISALASDTGGQLYNNTNDITGSIVKAFSENQSYYVLGYYLDETSNREFRRVAIKVKNHSEYTVRAPKGYWIDPNRTRESELANTPVQQFMKAILQPLPATGIDVSASANYLETENNPGNVMLTAQINRANLEHQEESDSYLFDFEVVSWIYDSSGKRIQDFADVVQGKLQSSALATAKQDGFFFTRQVSLKPGIYQVLFGVRENGTDRIGTASAWVQVPNLEHTGLAISSLMFFHPALTKETGMALEIGGPHSVQGIRMFSAGQPCEYHFRIQKTAAMPNPSGLEYQMEIVDAGKPLRRSEWLSIPLGNGDAKGIFVDGWLELANLHSGLYELRLSVRQTASKMQAQRIVVFGIE